MHTIHHGDCLEVMAGMPERSIDAIVTDPPYGLGLMGKKWDALPPGKAWAEECLRVLKPGGYLLAFGGTRTWHRLAVAIEDAGFEIRDSVAWMHSQGFPKNQATLKAAFEPIVLARKERSTAESGMLQIDACRIPTSEDTGRAQGSDIRGGNYILSPNKSTYVSKGSPLGRWPASVILDDAQAGDLEQQESGASRFFYVAKASQRERPDVDGIKHPTVKPLALMRWLVRLVTPPDGVVLDPFAGSGTTLEAAILEGFQVIGVEREAEYLPLIHHRIDRATEQLKTEQEQQAEAPDQGAFPLEEIA